jgi:hypothetical protein
MSASIVSSRRLACAGFSFLLRLLWRQRLPLLAVDCEEWAMQGIGPHELASVQRCVASLTPIPSCTSTFTVGAPVCEAIGVVRASNVEHRHHPCQRRLGAGAHVQRLGCQPDRIDMDNRSHSRSHTTHAPASLTGHRTVACAGPRDMRI